MFRFKPLDKAVTLPKLNGVSVDRDFCEPLRLISIRATNINPIDNVAVRPDNVRSVFFHYRPSCKRLPIPPAALQTIETR
jgi:hypothetical protein